MSLRRDRRITKNYKPISQFFLKTEIKKKNKTKKKKK